MTPSVPIVLRLERPGLRDAEVLRLLGRQLGELHADLGEMQRGDLLVEVLGQGIDLLLVLAGLGEQLDLGQRLVGERGRHHERGMAGRVAEIDEPAFGQKDDLLAVGELDLVDLRLDVVPLQVAQRRDLDLRIEVADVADDRPVMHLAHVVEGDDVDVAGGGDENVGARRGFVHRRDLVALHRRLKRADRVDFGDHDPAAGVAQRRGRALADVAEARDHRHLAGHHHVGAAADAVDQRLAAAVEVVELRLGDAVVDVDRRPQKLAFLGHHIEPMHAGGRLFGDAADRRRRCAVPAGLAS